MPLRSSSSASAIDPIELLSQKIAPAAKKKGNIKLAPNVIKAAKAELQTVRNNKTFVSDSIVVTIVSAFEEHDEACSRLDSATFAIILHTLLYAAYSRQKERGIILLTASLHHDTHKVPPPKTMETKKVSIGKDCIVPLLSCFTDTLENPRIRRWVGVLILELLEDCDKNRLTFESAPENSKRMLGTIVVEEQNEIVRITCGQLLRTMIAWKVPAQDLWPVGSDPVLYQKFPPPSQNEKHWNKVFQEYVDEQFANSVPAQDSGRLYFAQALDIRPLGTQISSCIISILVDRDVSICTQSTDAYFTESFEIPFSLITDGEMKATILEGITNPPVDVIFYLKPRADITCYRNSIPVDINEIRLTVVNEEVAYAMGQDILHLKSGQKASQSQEAIVIAQGFHDAVSPEDNEVVEDSNQERAKFYLDPSVLHPREETQNDDQDVEFDNFIEEPPQEDHITEIDTHFKPGICEPLVGNMDLPTEPLREENPVETVKELPPRSSEATRLSHQIENDKSISKDEENTQNLDVGTHSYASKRNPRRKAPPQTVVLKLAVPKPSSDGDFGDIARSVASSVKSPIAPMLPKTKPTRSKPKPKLKPKPKSKRKLKPKSTQEALTKHESPNETTKRVKKYSLKPKAEAPITKAPALKPVAAPRASGSGASISRARLRVSGVKQTSAPKLELPPKLASRPVSKSSEKMTSKLLVPRKQTKNTPTGSTRPMQATFPALDLVADERQDSLEYPQDNTAMGLRSDGQVALMKEIRATDRRASRLLKALAEVDDVEEEHVGFGDLIRTSPVYEPPPVTVRTESSSSSAPECIAVPAQENADSPKDSAPEVTHETSKEIRNQLPHVEFSSVGSPSSLDRANPLPRPVNEANPIEFFTPKATVMLSENLARPIRPRRSPRLASRYSNREASEALDNAQAKALDLAKERIVIESIGNDEAQRKHGNLHDDNSLISDESPLFNDYLARKTPLISFGAKGPRNQGISISKRSSQRVTRRQAQKLESSLLPTQMYTNVQSIKRKRHKEDVLMNNNKRQQTSRLGTSRDGTPIIREKSPASSHEDESPFMPRNHLLRKTARFGSQGSRVNENGSPLGLGNSHQEYTKYKSIARKVLTDMEPTATSDKVNDDTSFHYSDTERLKEVESDDGLFLSLPATSPTSFRDRPMSPGPDEEAIKRYLPQPRVKISEHDEIEKGFPHHQQEKPADPFLREVPERGLSSFARRLQYRKQSAVHKNRGGLTSPIPPKTRHTVNEDPEATLVNFEIQEPAQGHSSSSGTTYDRSDEDQELQANRTILEGERVPWDEWRAALKPHQRGILDVLYQVSSDLVRHLISHEQAVEDVLTEYEQGSMMLMKNLEKEHREDRRRIQQELDKVKGRLASEYREARQEISRIDKALRARSVRELEKKWMKEQDHMQSLVEEGMRRCR